MGLYYRCHINHGELTDDIRIIDIIELNHAGGCFG